jgi:hypothetical protein
MNIYGKKPNSLPGSNFRYSAAFRIDLIRMPMNSIGQTEYRSYLLMVPIVDV